MKEKIDLQEIMKRVLPKWLDKKDLKLEVKVVKPAVKVNILDKNGRVLFWGMSICSP